MRKHAVALFAVLTAVAIVFTLTGCDAIVQNAAKSAVEGATGVKVNQDGNGITVEGKDGEAITVGGDNALPEGFPADIPVYEGTISASMKSPKGFLVTIDAADPLATVADWYRTKLADEGWKIINDGTIGEGTIFTCEKATMGLTVAVGPGTSDKPTTVQISATQK
ncbi:MAG: hypothetical protein Q7W30_09220 [Coriobacteriia bacterium]|nr:hypothetical protein [Coriobacteriia bacterium]